MSNAKANPQADVGSPIGILGGTFDPVHHGHLRLAVQLIDQLGLQEVLMVPNARPPHRERPGASVGQRAKWLRIAASAQPGLKLDDRELIRPGPSYTVDTLTELRAENPQRPLCLAMGDDVFATLESWHRWEAVCDLAHLVVVPRPGLTSELPPRIRQLLAARETRDPADLRRQLAGRIYRAHFPLLEISGSEIRELIAAGHSPRYLLPESVLREIEELGVYR